MSYHISSNINSEAHQTPSKAPAYFMGCLYEDGAGTTTGEKGNSLKLTVHLQPVIEWPQFHC